MIFKIRVKGELDQGWSEWFCSIQTSSTIQEDGSVISTLIVDAADQSTLFGILDRIRDLNFFLISVAKDGEEF